MLDIIVLLGLFVLLLVLTMVCVSAIVTAYKWCIIKCTKNERGNGH